MSSKRRQRRHAENVCRGKIAYTSEQLARAAAWRGTARKRERFAEAQIDGYPNSVRAYKCPICKQWHIGARFRRWR